MFKYAYIYYALRKYITYVRKIFNVDQGYRNIANFAKKNYFKTDA